MGSLGLVVITLDTAFTTYPAAGPSTPVPQHFAELGSCIEWQEE